MIQKTFVVMKKDGEQIEIEADACEENEPYFEFVIYDEEDDDLSETVAKFFISEVAGYHIKNY